MKIAFISANCLLDPSSGAAITNRTLLRLLAEAGAETRSLTASIYDRAPSDQTIESMRISGAAPVDPGAPLAGLWQASDGPVLHEIVPVARSNRRLQSRVDEQRMLGFARRMLDAERPDVIITYGGGHFEREVVAIAQERSIVTVFYLAHPGYTSIDTFKNIDQVFTDTKTTRDLYRERLGLDPYAIGKFIDRPRQVAGCAPRFTTFVNPSAEKGVTLFYRIAELAAATAPDIQFLVVESRTTLAIAEQRTGMRFSALPNIRRVGLQRDMSEVFSSTRVFMQPSLWHESGARASIEAMSMGIPIVATDRGGIPEVLGAAGIMITPPEPLIDNHWLIPPLTAAVPWVEVLRSLHEDEAFYASHRALSLEGWAAHDPMPRVRDILDILAALLRAKRG